MLTDPKPVNAVGDPTVRARLLDARTEVGMSQSDAALVAARGIDHLPVRNGTVGVDPVAPPSSVSGGRVCGLLAVAVLLRW